MLESYSQEALEQVLAGVRAMRGWDFSGMNYLREPVPWEYDEVVLRYLRPSDAVLDIGCGGGDNLLKLAGAFDIGLGIDTDPAMVRYATEHSVAPNVGFKVCSDRLESVDETFDVIINRHASFMPTAVAAHLRPGGYFVTQQVGERNMACVKAALGQPLAPSPVRRHSFDASGLRLLAFMEYDVEYVVRDIESLVFWLIALDLDHADVDGRSAVASAATLNRVLAGNVDNRGFVTNEHRYLVVTRDPHLSDHRGPISRPDRLESCTQSDGLSGSACQLRSPTHLRT